MSRVSTSAGEQPVRDDRILPITRWVARFIVPFLAAAFLVLYGAPDRTTEFFAWTIRPDMTPLVMGAGYGTGVYFFYRVATADEWHRVAPVLLGITTFTWFMAAATVLHWGNFNHDHWVFYLWVFLYAVTPLLVPGVWVLNRGYASDVETTGGPRLPDAVRVVGAGLGIAVTVGAVVLFVAPGVVLDRWPWAVSPFTTRILAGWFALFGVLNVAGVVDPRWSGARLLVQTQIVGISMGLLGIVRAWDDFDPANPLTWGLVGGTVVYLGAIVVLYLVMERRSPDS